MSVTLIKLSDPGFIKEFPDQESARDHLFGYICYQCRCEEGLDEKSDIDSLLSSCCGLEFMIE